MEPPGWSDPNNLMRVRVFVNMLPVILLLRAIQETPSLIPILAGRPTIAFCIVAVARRQEEVGILLEIVRLASGVEVVDLHVTRPSGPRNVLHRVGTTPLKIHHQIWERLPMPSLIKQPWRRTSLNPGDFCGIRHNP